MMPDYVYLVTLLDGRAYLSEALGAGVLELWIKQGLVLTVVRTSRQELAT